jgi:hypothetical protein
MLCDALGFDKYEDLTTEYQVKGEFADYGIRIDKQLIAFIEVKRCTTALNERHLRQVQMYAHPLRGRSPPRGLACHGRVTRHRHNPLTRENTP